jgi:class 3 adenylate cyclase
MALLTMARGEVDKAHGGITRTLEDEREPLSRARLLPAAMEIALARDDVDTAKAGADELEEIAERFGSTALQAVALGARAAVQIATGESQSAVTTARESWRKWQEVEAPYEAARARLVLSQAFLASGDPEAGRMEIRAARSVFEKLGAVPDVRRASELLSGLEADEGGVRVVQTFMFTDIEKSTNLVEAIGDEAWENLVGWHDRTLRSLFAEHGGEEVDHSGDGFFVAFEDPRAALECATAIQRSLAEHRRSHGFAPKVRIGVHAAEATKRAGDYGGRGVHEAARIGSVATGDEIVASLATLEAAGGDWQTSNEREVELKGISTPAKVATVAWSPAAGS